MLRFILGQAGSGKKDLIFREIAATVNDFPYLKKILLVPEQYTLEAERELLTKTGMDGIMFTEVLSFQRLAYRVFNQAGGRKQQEITDIGKIMVLRNLFHQHQNQVKLYNKLAGQPGFLQNFNYLLTELKQNNITPDRIKQQQEQQESPVFADKLADIALIYNEYEEYMENRYRDREDKFELLIEKISQVDFLEGAEIWVDGFSGLTGQEYRIIEELLTCSNRLNFSLTVDQEQRQLFKPTLTTLENLKNIARKNNIEFREEILTDFNAENREIKYLQQNLYKYPAHSYQEKVDNISLFAGSNRYREVERVACEIIALVRDQDLRWRDVAVVCGAPEDYLLDIKRVFTEYEIPYFLDEKRKIINNSIIQCILSALQILDRNFRYRDLFTFVRTGFSDIDHNEADQLENFALRFGIEGKDWLEDFSFKTSEYDIDEINNIKNILLGPFQEYQQDFTEARTIKDYTLVLFAFLQELKLKEKIDGWIKRLREEGKYGAVNEHTQIWNVVIEVLEQLVEILGEMEVSLKEFYNILQAGFREYELGLIPPTLDQVLIGTVQRSRSHDIRALFVIGANDGVLPSSGVEEGILNDDEKIILKIAGLPLKTDSLNRIQEERFNIYNTLSKPRDYLWLSYALADNEGRTLRPSLLISRIKDIFPTLREERDLYSGDEITYITGPGATFKHLIASLRLYRKQGEMDDCWWDVYNWYLSDPDWSGKIKTIVEGLFYQNRVAKLNPEVTGKLFSLPFNSSISQLERFARCPFAHFINFGLQPEPRREYELDSLDIGIIFHRVLERYMTQLRNETEKINYNDFSPERNRQIMKSALTEVTGDFEYNIFNSSHYYRYLRQRIMDMGMRTADIILKHLQQGLFRIGKTEINFSRQGELPPVEIPFKNGGKLILEGRVDRVDYWQEEGNIHFKVIDYKTGRSSFSLAEAYYGIQVQLVIYLTALLSASEQFGDARVYPGGFFYFDVADPLINEEDIGGEKEREMLECFRLEGLVTENNKLIKALDQDLKPGQKSVIIPVKLNRDGRISKRSATIKEQDLYNLIDHIRNILSQFATEILQGENKIAPIKIGNYTACDFCEYGDICQFDSRFRANNYLELKKPKDQQIINILREERGSK